MVASGRPRFPAASKAAAATGLKYPRQDSNLCSRLRRPMLYPLSYGGMKRAGCCYDDDTIAAAF